MIVAHCLQLLVRSVQRRGWASFACGAAVGALVLMTHFSTSELLPYLGDAQGAPRIILVETRVRRSANSQQIEAPVQEAALSVPGLVAAAESHRETARSTNDGQAEIAKPQIRTSSAARPDIQRIPATQSAPQTSTLQEASSGTLHEECVESNSARGGHEVDTASKESSWKQCQERCQCTYGCQFFTYWPDGNCHVQTKSARRFKANGAKTGMAVCGAPTFAAPPVAVMQDLQRGPALRAEGLWEPGTHSPRVYVYELPRRFRNGGSLPECFSASCVFGGPPEKVFGVDIWSSNQFDMPRMLYYRFMNSPSRTRNLEEADVFLIPAYSVRPMFKETQCASDQDLYNTLFEMNPLLRQKEWAEAKGPRHLFVDARGDEVCSYMWTVTPPWRLFHRVNVELNGMSPEGPEGWTKGQPFFWYQFPYPSVYHGSAALTPARLRKRGHARYLWSFSGSGRGLAAELRQTLMQQCNRCAGCAKLTDINEVSNRVPSDYARVSTLKLQSTFCVEPPGDTITRKGLVDSMVLGCIPVVFEHQELDMYEPFFTAEEFAEAIVYVPEARVMGSRAPLSHWSTGPMPSFQIFERLKKAYPHDLAVFQAISASSEGARKEKLRALYPHPTKLSHILRNMSSDEVQRKQDALAEIAPRLVIALDDGSRDALHILLERIVSNDEAVARRSARNPA